jgi:hypothetical protein
MENPHQLRVDAYDRETGVTSEIRKRSLRWLGHVERRPEERSVKKVFKNIQEGKRFVGKPRKR